MRRCGSGISTLFHASEHHEEARLFQLEKTEIFGSCYWIHHDYIFISGRCPECRQYCFCQFWMIYCRGISSLDVRSASAPALFAILVVISSIRLCTNSCCSFPKVLMVPIIFTSSGIILCLIPPCIAPTVTTAGFWVTFTLLERIVCNPIIICEEVTIGSTLDQGEAP